MKTTRINTIIKGSLLVLTGEFPDIRISFGTTIESQNIAVGPEY